MISWQRLVNAATDFAPWTDRRKIGFMHIPRTSGTALVEAIGRTERPGRKVYALDRVLFGHFDAFDEFYPAVRRMIHFDPATLPPRARFLGGHMAYSTLHATGRGHLMTILREPRMRVLSHWMFWRNHSEADLVRLGSWGTRVRLGRRPLATFLSSPGIACQTDNLMTRMLLWPHPLIPADDFIKPESDAELTRAALARLDSFAFVDILENPAMLANLQAWLGRPIDYGRSNEAQPILPDRLADLPSEMIGRTMPLMSARCRLDAVLWMHIATRAFGEEAARMLGERVFDAGLERYGHLLAGAPPSRVPELVAA